MNKILSSFENKKILILGFGREGKSTLSFLRKYYPDKHFFIADRVKNIVKDDNTTVYYGDDYLESVSDFDLIIKSPGIPRKLNELKNIQDKITSQTKIFFELCRGKIIGVTGTKGKSTTASLIHSILENSGIETVLLGNIGKPCLDYLDDTYGLGKVFVFEMSSHQLLDLDISPHISVLLNIFREHLDYYRDFNEYLSAKMNITKYQKNHDYLIFNSGQEEFKAITDSTKANVLSFSQGDNNADCFVLNEEILFKDLKGDIKKIISIKEIPLKGLHNLNNVMASILVAITMNISPEIISDGIKKFEPLQYRLEKIGTFKGITFYSDSLATIPEATIAAINALDGKVGTLVLGGSDRGQHFSELVRLVLDQKIDNLILFPPTGDRIWDEISNLEGKKPNHFFVENMSEAVKLCYKKTPVGKICLLSAASPSFGIFKDYKDRGDQFRKFVELFSHDI